MGGEFWLIARREASMAGESATSILTLGYDAAAAKYIGTFVCSADGTLWRYNGEMDGGGRKLVLEPEGPSMVDPTQKAKYREVPEMKDKNHKVFTSFMRGDQGDWSEIVKMEYERSLTSGVLVIRFTLQESP